MSGRNSRGLDPGTPVLYAFIPSKRLEHEVTCPSASSRCDTCVQSHSRRSVMKTCTRWVQLEGSIRLDFRIEPTDLGVVLANEHVVGLWLPGISLSASTTTQPAKTAYHFSDILLRTNVAPHTNFISSGNCFGVCVLVIFSLEGWRRDRSVFTSLYTKDLI
jgi:hypothetical protein